MIDETDDMKKIYITESENDEKHGPHQKNRR
jgi:hypothetical protein